MARFHRDHVGEVGPFVVFIETVSLGAAYLGKMSLERIVFAPLERLADALHPYRWHFVIVALFAPIIFFALAYAGEEFWPEHASRVLFYAAPFLVNLMTWGWGARLIVAWYGPSRRRPRRLRRIPPEFFDPLAPIKRVWHLLVLVVFLLFPCLLWFAWYLVPGR